MKADPLLYLGSLKSSNPLPGLPKNNSRLVYIHVQHSQLHSERERERENNNNNSHRKKERNQRYQLSRAWTHKKQKFITHNQRECCFFFPPLRFSLLGLFSWIQKNDERAQEQASLHLAIMRLHGVMVCSTVAESSPKTSFEPPPPTIADPAAASFSSSNSATS